MPVQTLRMACLATRRSKPSNGFKAGERFKSMGKWANRRGRRYSMLILRAALAGYNAGPGNVLNDIRAGRDIDHHTAGGDYSKDVLKRAGWYQQFARWA